MLVNNNHGHVPSLPTHGQAYTSLPTREETSYMSVSRQPPPFKRKYVFLCGQVLCIGVWVKVNRRPEREAEKEDVDIVHDGMGLSAPATLPTNTLSLKSFIAVSTFTANDNRVNTSPAFEMMKTGTP